MKQLIEFSYGKMSLPCDNATSQLLCVRAQKSYEYFYDSNSLVQKSVQRAFVTIDTSFAYFSRTINSDRMSERKTQ
ncbi:hypothetical protein KPH14_008386 [Odynerus spinipes]|uniref:Uncharacterized protein n=1 Tax=Odynerus spinipes TaxID=1348599 RepID=A0AAD9RUJ5_9HYME|nr:hypothetical protein KPH14_008386 [Odynerus spinipes]